MSYVIWNQIKKPMIEDKDVDDIGSGDDDGNADAGDT